MGPIERSRRRMRAVLAAVLLGGSLVVGVPSAGAAPGGGGRQPSFTLSTSSISFGTVLVGSTKPESVTVTAGRKAVAIQTGTSFVYTDTRAGTCHTSYLSQDQPIPAGATCTILVQFAPTLAEAYNSGGLAVTACKTGLNLSNFTCVRPDNSSAQFVTLTGQGAAPDLDIAGISLGDGVTACGYTVTVRNVGNAVADLTGVGVQGYFEPTAVYESNTGNPAGGQSFNNGATISPSTTTTITVGSSLCGGVGDKFLVVRVDSTNALTESNETNNDFAKGLVDFVVDDIAVTGADGTNLFAHTVTVKNIGGGAYDGSALSMVKTYFSADANLDSGDRSTDCQRVLQSAIAADGQTGVEMPCSSTPQAGEAYLIAVVDAVSTQYEARENNNTFALLLPQDDLVMSAVTGLQFNGTTTSFEAQVTVNGPLEISGPTVTVRAIWSDDDTIGDADDNPACSSAMPAGEYSNGDVVVVQISCADQGPGTADRLITIADALNAVAESNEANNVFTSFLGG